MRRRGDSTLTRGLFPEEIVEGGARIKTSSVHGTSGIVCFPLDRSSRYKKVAGVSNILFRDSFRNRLRAFELSARVKIAAILAGPQIGTAFRARAFQTDFHGGRDDGPAHRTPQEPPESPAYAWAADRPASAPSGDRVQVFGGEPHDRDRRPGIHSVCIFVRTSVANYVGGIRKVTRK